MPFIDKVVFDIEKEAVPLQEQVPAGLLRRAAMERLDYGTGFIVAMADRRQGEEYKEGHQAADHGRGEQLVIGFNWLDPVVGKGKTPEQAERNRKLRQAIVYRDRLGRAHRDFREGQGVAAHGPLPPSLFGYRDDGPSAFNPVVYRKEPTASRSAGRSRRPSKLLAEAGFPDGRDAKTGKPLVLNFDYQQSATPGVKAMMDWYTKQFAKIGIQLEIRATDYNRFQDKMNKGSAPDLLLGLAGRLPGRRELPVHALRAQRQGADQRQRREQRELPEPGVRQALREMKFLEDGPEKQTADRRDDHDRAEGRRVELRLLPHVGAAYHQWIDNGKPTQIMRNHISYLRLDPELRTAKLAEWNRPVWWPVPLILSR